MINSLHITNFLGTFDRQVHFAGVTLVAGPNGAGKTTIAQAIRFALGGDPGRVTKKSEYKRLLADGKKTGSVGILLNDTTEYTRAVESGNYASATPQPMTLALPFTLEPNRFAALNEAERRRFLFRLMGIESTGAAIAEMLTGRNCNPSLVERVKPLLRSGFDAAFAHAKEQAREIKGRWREVTGEQWGSAKAASWRPQPVPTIDTSAIMAAIKKIDEEIKQANQRAGANQRDIEVAKQRRAQMAESAARLPELKTKEAALNQQSVDAHKQLAELGGTVEPVHGHSGRYTCPCCGAALTISQGGLIPWEDNGPETDEILSLRNNIRHLQTALADIKRTIAEAKRDEEQLTDLPALPEADSNADEISDLLQQLEDRRATAQADLENAQEQNRKADAVIATCARADDLNAQIDDWLVIAGYLAPDGIPAELLAGALTPFNQALGVQHNKSDWPLVQVSPDMAITYGGRDYALCAESEQWRADAMLGAAIAQIAEEGPLILDRIDVLDLPNRGAALRWMASLNHQVIALGTFKAPPTVGELPVEVHWLGETTERVAA